MRYTGQSIILLRLPAPAIALAIFILSSFSALPMPDAGLFAMDKIAHLIAYGFLSFAICLWFSSEQWESRPGFVALIVICIASLYGMSDEFHQSFVPGRDVSLYDWIADTAGSVIAVVLYRFPDFVVE